MNHVEKPKGGEKVGHKDVLGKRILSRRNGQCTNLVFERISKEACMNSVESMRETVGENRLGMVAGAGPWNAIDYKNDIFSLSDSGRF